jgi:stress-induced-phosphoprotein 1
MYSRLFSIGEYPKAIQYYTEALQIDPNNHTLFSNRAAAYLKLRMYEEALRDARESTRLLPTWIKVRLVTFL